MRPQGRGDGDVDEHGGDDESSWAFCCRVASLVSLDRLLPSFPYLLANDVHSFGHSFPSV